MQPGHSIDRRSPLVVDVKELARVKLRELGDEVPAPVDFGIDVIKVPQGSPLDLDLRLEAVVEGVLVSGKIGATVQGQCVRCLTELERHESFEVQELYFYPGHNQEEDELLVVEDMVDLQPAIRDAVVLELPFAPVCREDCRGLCPECGADLNDDPEHNHGQRVDPRWERLAELNVDDQVDR
ncbi:MAG: metal-binding protein [Arachnia propionica]|nr:MAG: metal-binding protein [Arachnia propionica]